MTDDAAYPAVDFQLLFESAPGLLLVLHPDLTIAAASHAYLRATMTRRAEVIGRHIFDVFPDNPDEVDATGVSNLRTSLGNVVRLRQADTMAIQKYDIRRPAADGGGFEERHWSPVNAPIFRDDGTLAYILHRVEDVTDFVRSQQQQQLQSQAMQVELYQRAQEIQEANHQLHALQADLERRVLARTADLQRANEDLQRHMAERQKAEAALHHSEEQLRQAQKLEAVGRLAGGIAHDFNNLLSVVLSYATMLLEDLKENDISRPDIEEIKRAGERAADLTKQLLAFSRQQVIDPKLLDFNDIVGVLNRMLMRLLGEDIELRTLLTPNLPPIRADRGQLEQVVMNLVVNARDAMPHGGKLTIETAHVELTESYASSHVGVIPGWYVMLAVSDTGGGMDRATQARAFEPFFTTKELGKGTGLGLSTLFGIVKQSGGHIWLYSELGTGTTFKIYFPRAEGTAERIGAPAKRISMHGAETILLVEDEDQVRTVVAGMLRRFGYNVLEAKSPGEALLISEQHPVRIHCLLTDVVMPKMNGRDLAQRISTMRPTIKVLFMSGYTDNVITQHGVLDSDVAFVQKPLTPETLGAKLRQVLTTSAD